MNPQFTYDYQPFIWGSHQIKAEATFIPVEYQWLLTVPKDQDATCSHIFSIHYRTHAKLKGIPLDIYMCQECYEAVTRAGQVSVDMPFKTLYMVRLIDRLGRILYG